MAFLFALCQVPVQVNLSYMGLYSSWDYPRMWSNCRAHYHTRYSFFSPLLYQAPSGESKILYWLLLVLVHIKLCSHPFRHLNNSLFFQLFTSMAKLSPGDLITNNLSFISNPNLIVAQSQCLAFIVESSILLEMAINCSLVNLYGYIFFFGKQISDTSRAGTIYLINWLIGTQSIYWALIMGRIVYSALKTERWQRNLLGFQGDSVRVIQSNNC